MHWSDIVIRLAVAAAAGAVMGIEFELRERPGGLRTHLLSTFGAALFCVVASRVAGGSPEALRAVQGIVSGIGFIGAATVLRLDGTVKGVATAASIWVSAAIGCAAGFGEWVLALVLAPLVALVNVATLRIEQKWFSKKS